MHCALSFIRGGIDRKQKFDAEENMKPDIQTLKVFMILLLMTLIVVSLVRWSPFYTTSLDWIEQATR